MRKYMKNSLWLFWILDIIKFFPQKFLSAANPINNTQQESKQICVNSAHYSLIEASSFRLIPKYHIISQSLTAGTHET